MASPEVAVGFSLTAFDKFNGPRSKLRSAQIPVTAFSEMSAWTGAAAAAAVAAAEFGLVDVKEEKSLTLTLPAIDLGGLQSGDAAERARIVREVGNATEEWGFFQVVNHGVSDELVEKVHEQSRRFFNLPLKMKKRAEIGSDCPNPRFLGYKGTFDKNAKNKEIPLKESLAGFRSASAPMSALAAKIWSAGDSEFSNTLEDHCTSMEALGHRLLELLAESLGLQSNFFSRHFKDGADCIGTWRLHHFPPNSAPSHVWRTVPHSDPSVLTILKQDVGGLQVKKPGGGLWIDVHPLRGSFVVNVGDILEAWSNGRFPSVEHRVALSEEGERFSTVNFLDAGLSMAIEAPQELIDDEHPSLFRPFIAGDFRANFEKIKLLGDIRKGKALDYVRKRVV